MSSQPFVAEIQIFPFNFAPTGWAFCAGQLLSISQNTALFSLVGTYYGGDGRSTFGLPNLQGAAPMHTDQYSGGGVYPLGEQSGTATVTLLTTEMPSHTHNVLSDANALHTTSTSPSGAAPSNTAANLIYSTAASASATMNPLMLGFAGNSQPHNNMMPYLTLNFCIALQGVYPARS